MSKLEGQVAVVTGASRGIGRAIAIKLASMGARVVVNYRSNQAAAEQVLDLIRQQGGQAIAVQADVSVFADAQRLIQTALDQWGKVDILVNNAGTTRDTLLVRMTCLLYTSDAADDLLCVDLGGRRLIKQKNEHQPHPHQLSRTPTHPNTP